MVHEGAHEMTLPSVKARSVRRSVGTWSFLTLETVGAEDAGDQITATVFSLSVNETLPLFVTRDHPSGTFTTNLPSAERYGTNCVLSGMSPGGLLSAGTGLSDGIGLSEGDVEAPPDGWTEEGVGEDFSEEGWDPPQAARSRAPTTTAGTTGPAGTVVHRCHGFANRMRACIRAVQ